MIKVYNILYMFYKVLYFNKEGRAIFKRTQIIFLNKDLKWLGYTFYPFIIVRSLEDKETINHEMIHIQQMKELWVIGFLLIYGINYLTNLIKYKGDGYKAYRNIIFEREAYNNEGNLLYLTNRPKYNFLKR